MTPAYFLFGICVGVGLTAIVTALVILAVLA